MILGVPSFIVRRILKKGMIRQMNGIREISLTGKIIRRTRNTCTLFDSFSGIHAQTSNPVLHSAIDKSINEDYLVHLTCSFERIPRPRLLIRAVRQATFTEEMYRTIESIEYWKKIQSQKQPK
ncbi:hypothetical protein NEMIN01_2085 [Nematocida minor]|uniref:uncharacterized protein n=1 Tax=Nematocida minor TaxID=1912983 RepID=UPI00221FB8EA|nr:uncharacterized protein NEMIN01_2085 [Nematocida minor]KAI5192572.1 hypothetical protein NEMIN01_2085 [Nematocida minor]